MGVAGDQDRATLGSQHLHQAGYGGGLARTWHAKDEGIVLGRDCLGRRRGGEEGKGADEEAKVAVNVPSRLRSSGQS